MYNIAKTFIQQQIQLAKINAEQVANVKDSEEFSALVVLNLEVYKRANFKDFAKAFVHKLTLLMSEGATERNLEMRLYLTEVSQGKNALGKKMKRFLK